MTLTFTSKCQDKLESEFIQLQAIRYSSLNLVSKLNCSANIAQQALEQAQACRSLHESHYQSTSSQLKRLTSAVESGTMTMTRLRAAVEASKDQDRGDDRSKLIDDKIDLVEAVLRQEVVRSAKINEEATNAFENEIEELKEYKEQLSKAQTELEGLQKKTQSS